MISSRDWCCYLPRLVLEYFPNVGKQPKLFNIFFINLAEENLHSAGLLVTEFGGGTYQGGERGVFA